VLSRRPIELSLDEFGRFGLAVPPAAIVLRGVRDWVRGRLWKTKPMAKQTAQTGSFILLTSPTR
jgi:hypothetical protein